MGARAPFASDGCGAQTDPGDHPQRHCHTAKTARTTRGCEEDAWRNSAGWCSRIRTGGAGPHLTTYSVMKRVSIVDSHTAGEPTRIVVGGGPELEGQSAAEKLKVFREQHDQFRSAV